MMGTVMSVEEARAKWNGLPQRTKEIMALKYDLIRYGEPIPSLTDNQVRMVFGMNEENRTKVVTK